MSPGHDVMNVHDFTQQSNLERMVTCDTVYLNGYIGHDVCLSVVDHSSWISFRQVNG